MNWKLLHSLTWGSTLAWLSISAQAGNQWSNYQGVDTRQYAPPPMYPKYPQHGYNGQQRPSSPYNQHRPPYPPHPMQPPRQNGITIQYQAPTTIIQNSQSYAWVNGDPNSAQIQSSRYTFISDWRRLGLPAPPMGMYWIMENGRYTLVPNH